ncbi:MAG: methyltransferase domain-containing protein [Candidatus Rokubacteria bacterium]|nr:methyltransferase domain-containing protein [Candidatus Rokubacteria bacterium]
MSQAERERRAYDETAMWQRCHDAHMRFRHVFECPNTRRGDRLFTAMLEAAVPGRRVLELGCGDGTMARHMLDRGARHVLAADVSERFLSIARTRTIAGRLEFANLDVAQPIAGEFDVIFGSAILHHLDHRRVLAGLYERNLSPGGRMIFREPLGSNLLLRLWWRLGAGAHTADERPFYAHDLRWLRERFPGFQLSGINYLSLPAAIASSLVLRSADNALLRATDAIDDWLDRHCPWLRPRFRQAVMVIDKRP